MVTSISWKLLLLYDSIVCFYDENKVRIESTMVPFTSTVHITYNPIGFYPY